MRIICPSCGAIWSAEAGTNDASCRTFMGVLVKLPPHVQDLVLPYLALFRQGAKGLSWPRALRLIADLKAAIETGTVQWDNGETRPAPPELWARAMDAAIKRHPEALSNHNYLRRTCWDMAKGLAAQAERTVEEGRRLDRDAGGDGDAETRGHGDGGIPRHEGYEQATEEDRAAMARMMRDFLHKTKAGE